MTDQPNDALVFDGVTHRYGDGPAVLDGFCWRVPSGVVGVLGNNGVGKSTLLKLAAGFVRPTRGKVRIAGVDSTGENSAEARGLTGFLPESITVDGRLTAREFLTFAAHIRKVENGPDIAMALLGRLGVADKADELMRGLSFGSRRKVGLAATFLVDTRVLVLDEPSNGLDVASIQVVEELIAERRANGTAVVLSSHDMGFVARTCESLLVLLGGGRFRQGSPAELVAETGMPDLHHAFRELVAG